MTLCDIVGRLFQRVCKKGAVHHGFFFAGASCCKWPPLSAISVGKSGYHGNVH